MRKQYVTVRSWIFVSCFVNRIDHSQFFVEYGLDSCHFVGKVNGLSLQVFSPSFSLLPISWTLCCVAAAIWRQWGDDWKDEDAQYEHTGAEGSCDFSSGHKYQHKSTTMFKFLLIYERKTKINFRNFYYLVSILFQVIIFYWESNYNLFIHYLETASYLLNISSASPLSNSSNH